MGIRSAIAVGLAALALAAATGTASASVGNFAMVVQPDGRILAAGGSGQLVPNGHKREFGAVVRYLPDGSLDRSFGGGDGVVIARPLAPFTAIALQRDGRILLTSPIGQVSRLLPDGRFDHSFGVKGRKYAGASSAYYPTSVAVGGGGAIWVGGMTGYLNDPGEHWYGRLYRLSADGRSGDWVGSMTTGDGRPGEPKSVLNDFLLRKGSVVGVGTVAPREADARSVIGLGRLIPAAGGVFPSGPDPSFGGGAGLVESTFFPTDPRSETGNAIARDAAGNLLVAGEAAGRMLLARYGGTGLLDAGFGNGGVALGNVHGAAADRANAVLVQPSGRIVVAGSSDFGCAEGCASLAIARFHADGQLDRSFGHGGRVSPAVEAGGRPATETAYALANQRRGAILVGGLFSRRGINRFFLRRYLADGHRDRSFGRGGRVTTLPLSCRGSVAQQRASGCLAKANVALRVRHLDTRFPAIELTVKAPAWEGLHAVHLSLPPGLEANPGAVLAEPHVQLDGSGFGAREAVHASARRIGIAPRLQFHRRIRLRLSAGQVEATGSLRSSRPLVFRVKVQFAGGSSQVLKLKRSP